MMGAVCVLLLVMIVALDVTSIFQSKESRKDLIQQRMREIAQIAAAHLDGDELASFTASDAGSEKEARIKETLLRFKDNADFKYIYVVRRAEDGSYIFVVDPDPDRPASFGTVILVTDALIEADRGNSAADDQPASDEWAQNYYSAFAPVFTSDESVGAIVGVDFDGVWFDDQFVTSTWSIILISAGSFLIGAVIVFIITRVMKRRFNVLYGDLSRLADDIDMLNREMISNTILEADAAQDKPFDDVRETIRNSAEDREASGDVIQRLGEKIQTTQSQLKDFVDRMHEQAYLDPGTGVRNKTAYLELVDCLNAQIEDGTAQFAVVVFDLNALKQVNDLHGHAVGDQFIKDNAFVFRRVFGFEELFRIGGDEFIAVVEKGDPGSVAEKMRRLNEEAAVFNAALSEGCIPVSFSAGTAVFQPESDCRFQEVFARADEEMYRRKAEFYQGSNDRRMR